jgi:PAS domain S-box-containing protein
LQEQNVDIFAEAYPDLSYRQEVLDFVAAATSEWVDLKIKVRDGRVIDTACAVVRLSDGTRVAIAQDITERKEAEETLKESETQLAAAQRMAHVGSWDWDLHTGTVTWSEELFRIFGLQPGAIKAAGDAAPFVHPDDRDLVWNTVRRAVSNKEPYSFYFRILRPNGTERIAHSRGSVVSDDRGEAIRVYGVTQDVTELKRAEERLNETTEQLRALSARLQSAREEESKRIAREIHDELGGALTSWKWDLEEIREGISEPLGTSQVSTLQAKIDGMIKLTETTLDTVRKLASELRPMALELGLVEAIEWEAIQFENRTGIHVE